MAEIEQLIGLLINIIILLVILNFIILGGICFINYRLSTGKIPRVFFLIMMGISYILAIVIFVVTG